MVDVDGNEYADFCLGDTGAMAGHSPEPTMRASRAGRAHDDAPDRGRGLGGRGARPPLRAALLAVLAHRHRRQPLDAAHLPPGDRPAARCSSSTGATTARSTRRSSRSAPTAWCARARATSARRSTRRETTRVAEFNEIESVEAALAHGDVACLLMEPALTNIGIVLPEDGFLEARARRLHARRHAADHRRDAHAQRRARAAARRPGASSPTRSRSASRSAAACRSAPTA